MAKIENIREVPVGELIPYSRNAKKHDQDQVEKIAQSIQEFGFLNPCLIDKNRNIIAGHGRVMAAKKLGLKTVPCVYIEGLTEEQRRAYIIADNRLTELGEWDMDLVSEELQALRDQGFEIGLTGFDVDDIQISDDFGVDEETEAEGKEPIKTRNTVKRGDIWKLGEHRLMCGDSTNAADVRKLIGKQQMDLCVTDPPYNVALGTESGHPLRPSEAKAMHRRMDGLAIENDAWENDADFIGFLKKAFDNMIKALKPGGSFYIWYASTQAANFLAAAAASGLQIRQTLIWVKNTFSLGRQDYQWQHEPCLYGWKPGAAHYFIDVRSLATVFDGGDFDALTKEQAVQALKRISENTSTVLRENKPSASEMHPTMKPLPLIEKQIRNSSEEGQKVLDLFGGSGTTLMACQELERKCFMMEYDERYAASIIDRWEDETGEKAEKVEN